MLEQLWYIYLSAIRDVMMCGETELDVKEFSRICDLLVCVLQKTGLLEKHAIRFMVLLVKTIYTTDYGWYLHSENSVWDNRWRKWDNPETRGDVGFNAFLAYLDRNKLELPVERFFVPEVRGDGCCLIHDIILYHSYHSPQ